MYLWIPLHSLQKIVFGHIYVEKSLPVCDSLQLFLEQVMFSLGVEMKAKEGLAISLALNMKMGFQFLCKFVEYQIPLQL